MSYKTQSTVTRTQSELMLKENQYENVTCVHVFRRITEKTFSVSVLGCKGSAAHAAHKCCSNDPKTLTHPKPTDANRGKETHRHCRHSLLLHVSSCLLQMLFFFILYFFLFFILDIYNKPIYKHMYTCIYMYKYKYICVCVYVYMHSCIKTNQKYIDRI